MTVPGDARSALPSVVAIIPVGTLAGAKSRLGGVLDAEERHDLVTRLARRTIRSTLGSAAIAETIVVTPDDEVRGLAADLGARPIRQRSDGLNAGLREARDEAMAAGAGAVLVLPIDLPDVSVGAVDAIVASLDLAEHDRPFVGIVADRHGRGTNALLVRPPDAIGFCFGGDSRAAHVAAARSIGATLVELDGALAWDLDTPDDLLLLDRDDPRMTRR